MAETQFIDVSSHQGSIDPVGIRNHGVKGVAWKATEGTTFVDPSFGSVSDSNTVRIAHLRERHAALEKARLVSFPYHFCRADNRPTTAGAREEARWFSSVLDKAGYPHGKPVVLDYEVKPVTTAWAEAFADEIQKLRGRGVMTYVGRFFWNAQRAPKGGQLLWLPAYVTRSLANTYFAYMRARGFNVKAWQYTSSGRVTGVGGNVDRNVWFGNEADFRRWAKAPSKPPPSSTPTPVPVAKLGVADLQRALNRFTSPGRWVSGIAPILTDGIYGPATANRVREVKYWLGYGDNRTKANWPQDTPPLFVQRVLNPNGSVVPAKMRAVGKARRTKQRALWAASHFRSLSLPNVGWYDGQPCANWMIPYLEFARRNGWKGWLVNGHRTPRYSESLCYRICGKPKCPGVCAGRGSRHEGTTSPNGALDVTDYTRFGQLMAKCPLKPVLFNKLPRDLVHYSAFGN